jgi:hypothetical protein
VVSAGWTVMVTVVLAVYATITGEAGWGVLAMGAAAGGSLAALSKTRPSRRPLTEQPRPATPSCASGFLTHFRKFLPGPGPLPDGGLRRDGDLVSAWRHDLRPVR